MKKLVLLLTAAALLGVPSAASATNAIGGVGSPYHWAGSSNPRQITISDGVEPTSPGQASYNFAGVFTDWNTFGTGFVKLTQTTGSANITTQRGSYGNNGWLGLAQFWLRKGHFSRVRVKLNDYYQASAPQYYTPTAAQQTLCQEVGHGLGLDHQYLIPGTDSTGISCMNDQNVPPADYPDPNSHDANELSQIYQHTDVAGGRPKREAGPYVLDVIPAPGHGHASGHGSR